MLRNLNHLLVAICTIIFLLTTTSDALQCYSCNMTSSDVSKRNALCTNPQNYVKTVCPFGHVCFHGTFEVTVDTDALDITTISTMMSCAVDIPGNECEKILDVLKEAQKGSSIPIIVKKTQCYTCNKDLCNGIAKSATVNFGMLIAALVVAASNYY